jgi:membrane protein YqaA with SNARE-associated domain
MKQFENSTETHKVYLEMFGICFISFSVNVNAKFELFPMHAATVTHRRWLWLVKFALEGTGSGGWYTWSFTCSHRHKPHEIRSGDVGS